MAGDIITNRIREDLKKAIKARDRARMSTLRMLVSNLKNAQLEEKGELSEEKEVSVLSGYARRCRESIDEFGKGGREDLVSKERAELEIVMSYLPEQMNEEEIDREAKNVIEELGASGPRDAGRVIGEIMKRFKGRADGKTVNRIVSNNLQNGQG